MGIIFGDGIKYMYNIIFNFICCRDSYIRLKLIFTKIEFIKLRMEVPIENSW